MARWIEPCAAAVLILCATGTMAQTPTGVMVIVDERTIEKTEPNPHGKIGLSTSYRISDQAPNRSMEFRKRILHPGSAIGLHPIDHDEVYYVMSGTGEVTSDGISKPLSAGMAAYLYSGSEVGIKQTGPEPLTLIIAYPLKDRKP
ncbi:cupin domain-containing protein [Asticcacaulis sp. W401b]|uniref:cupin domain-containing protein n=1 Tax=Asticcacaulis sp. W401b TaxID=3388666 RepID=UPI003970BC49